MHSPIDFNLDLISAHYEHIASKVNLYRKKAARSLTLAEKILFAHAAYEVDPNDIKRGRSFIQLKPDRVAMQDATAQMAILQFIQSGIKKVAVPSTVHCDHLIRAYMDAETDLKTANNENKEVFDFLSSASQKYGIGFWGPGSGIIHQVVLENYAFPGALIIGTDSHTPNGGGLGMLAIGVGGADAVDVMAGMAWELLFPKIVGVKLKGTLKGWTSPKDIILKVLDLMTVKGGTNKIIEYFGPGADSISCTGKATITNMGAELGATTSVFPYDHKMGEFLEQTQRSEVAKLANAQKQFLRPDEEVVLNPEAYYDQVIEIDLDELEPYIVGPHSPDLARPVSKLASEVDTHSYPNNISACLIGSCTNSSYEDIYKAAMLAKEALNKGIKSKVPLFVSPGSMQIYATIKRDGLLDILEKFGGQLLANACGPCIGQWKRDDISKGDVNTIVTSFNRNFRGRNDANPDTLGFISSPEMVIAYSASGELKFNPQSDFLISDSGTKVKLTAPEAVELPPNGFVFNKGGYIPPHKDGEDVELAVSQNSERLQLLEPFLKWNGQELNHLTLLVKAQGKCTTDHISPAGKWLRYRGHLDKISDNMLLGANNAFHSIAGEGLNQLTGEYEMLSAVARQYKQKAMPWFIVGDENYGEGSSREHAAMSPRFLGAACVLVKSFARIHETNLKKQGVLALTFANPKDYDLLEETDQLSTLDLSEFAPGKKIRAVIDKKDGRKQEIELEHSYNKEQIEWFKAGSALNILT